MIERRRYMGLTALPYDAEIEYLESTGTQWIDTLISPDPTTGVKGVVMATEWGGKDNQLCLGCSENGVFNRGKGFAYDLRDGSVRHWAYVGGNTTLLSGGANINQWYSFEMNYLNSRVCYDTIMNSTVNINSGNQSTQLTMFLFKISMIDGISQYSIKGCRFVNVQFTKGSNIVRDFVPVRIGQVGYMYDKVSGQLFGNSGTGDFILGPDKNSVTIMTQQQQYEMYG